MKLRMIALVAAAAVVTVVAARAADVSKGKCPVSNRDAVETSSSDYKGGKVFFCCERCPGAFDAEKHATKANAQLVATGQAVQEACPITGRDLNEETKIKVAGAKVAFCCNRCKAKVEEAEGDEQLNLVFGEEAFEKGGFKVKN